MEDEDTFFMPSPFSVGVCVWGGGGGGGGEGGGM